MLCLSVFQRWAALQAGPRFLEPPLPPPSLYVPIAPHEGGRSASVFSQVTRDWAGAGASGESLTCDVAVIGGGLAGLICAIALRKALPEASIKVRGPRRLKLLAPAAAAVALAGRRPTLAASLALCLCSNRLGTRHSAFGIRHSLGRWNAHQRVWTA